MYFLSVLYLRPLLITEEGKDASANESEEKVKAEKPESEESKKLENGDDVPLASGNLQPIFIQ